VDVLIAVNAETVLEADHLIQNIEVELRKRLGQWIYGVDEDTLEKVALQRICALGWNLCVVEAGLDGLFIRRLAQAGDPFVGGEVITNFPSKSELPTLVKNSCQLKNALVGLGIVLEPGETQQTLHIYLVTPNGDRLITRTYGGPPQLAPIWGINISLDLVRNL
jgi:hypothetical protein